MNHVIMKMKYAPTHTPTLSHFIFTALCHNRDRGLNELGTN